MCLVVQLIAVDPSTPGISLKNLVLVKSTIYTFTLLIGHRPARSCKRRWRWCRKKTGCGGSATRSAPRSPATDDRARNGRRSRPRRAMWRRRRRRRATARRHCSGRRAVVRPSAKRRRVVASPASTEMSKYTAVGLARLAVGHGPAQCIVTIFQYLDGLLLDYYSAHVILVKIT